MKLTVEWREGQRGTWRKSHVVWTFEDVNYLNNVCGYQKYRITNVVAA